MSSPLTRTPPASRRAEPELVAVLIDQGFLSFEDVAVLTPAELMEMGVPDEDTAQDMIYYADEEAQHVEKDVRVSKSRESAQASAPSAGAPPQPARSDARTAFDQLFAQPAEGVEAAVQEEAVEEQAQEAAEVPPAEEEANVAAAESVPQESEVKAEELPPG